MNTLHRSRTSTVAKGALATVALALTLNFVAPAPQAQAGLLRGAIGGAIVGGIIGGRRGAGAGAVIGGIAGAARAGDRRRAVRHHERRELAYERRRLEDERYELKEERRRLRNRH